MKFLVISDLHGNTDILDKLDKQFDQADGVLFAGDFAKFGEEATALPALEALCKKTEDKDYFTFAVLGNCDKPEFIRELEKKDICVQKCLEHTKGLCFAGSGGGSKFTGTTPFEREDEDLVSDFDIIRNQGEDADWANLIAIMHNPPKDTKCDMIEGGIHVGSPALRTFIEKTKPLAVVTGHIHESAGIDKIGNTTVINPGPLLEGKYAWLQVEKEGDSWQVKNASLESL